MPSQNSTPTPVPIVTPTPTGAPHATATPTAPPSSAAVTEPLVSGQPISLPAVNGYRFALTFDAAPGTTIPANTKITAEAFSGLPGGAPQPVQVQARRRFVTGPDVLASVKFSFSANASLLYTLEATIPGATPGSSYTAQTFDQTSGTLLATIVAITAKDGTTTFVDPTPIDVVAGHEYVTELFLSPATATPTPTMAPTATPMPTATPTATPPPVALFAANNPGSGVAEFDALTGNAIQTFATSLTASLLSVDNAGRVYIFNGSAIEELPIGASSAAATYQPTSATPLSFSVASGGEMVVAGLSGTTVVYDEWDAGASGSPSRTISYAEPNGPEYTFALGPDGKLYVPYVAGGVQKFDQILADSLTVNRTFTESLASKATTFTPNVMAATANGSLYVGEWSFQLSDTNAGMYVFSPTGTESKVKTMDPGIVGIDFDSANNVYVASNNAVPNGSNSESDDTAEQLSVYTVGAASLKQQTNDGVPGVGALTVGSDGTAYLVQYESYGANAPAHGAIYSIAPGGTVAADIVPSINTNNVVLLYNGTTARDLNKRAAFHASLVGSAKAPAGRLRDRQ